MVFPPMLLLLLLLGWIYKAQKVALGLSKSLQVMHLYLLAKKQNLKILAHHQNKSLDGSDSKPTK